MQLARRPSPRPACGERSSSERQRRWRVRGALHRLRLAEGPPHPEQAQVRACSDLSPQAGRGEDWAEAQRGAMRGFLLGLTAATVLVVGCAAAAPRIVAATTDVAALAAMIGGDLVAVETIVPPAVDPEAFEPRPSDLDKVRHADLLVRVGLGYDYWLDKLVAQTGDKRLMRGGDAYVDASAGVPLLEIRGQTVVNEGGHAHGVANPHYWLDPENAKIITAGIAAALARVS